MKPLHRCVCCDSVMPPPFLDLGRQPLANSYYDGVGDLPAYPLAVSQCSECTHRQLTVVVDPSELFLRYLYVSGTSHTLRAYFGEFAERIVREQGPGISVLDIGCNDGSFVKTLEDKGLEAWGVDPAENLTRLACEKGLQVATGYWSDSYAQTWKQQQQAIVAMNVVGHVATPFDFLCGCKRVLAPGGQIYVQTSQCDWVEKGEFDCVYHEHVSYFTEHSFRTLAKRVGLTVKKVEKMPIHGTSWLFTLGDPLAEFVAGVEGIRQWIQNQVRLAHEEGYAVVGYGAAAKGNTFLNYAGVELAYIVDDNPLKWGLRTPGMKIPICPTEALSQEERPIKLLLLAWNFEAEIVAKVRTLRAGRETVFLRYFPTPSSFA